MQKYVKELDYYTTSPSKKKRHMREPLVLTEDSNKVIAMLFDSKKDKQFLEKKFRRQIDKSIPELKMVYAYKKDKPMVPDPKNVNDARSVSVELLQNKIHQDVGLIDELSKMHQRKHGYTPTVLVNPTKELASYDALRRYIAGEKETNNS